MATCKNCIHEKVCKYTNEKISIGTTVGESIHECKDYVSAADVVEVVRCKDCKYWTGRDYDGCCIANGLATRYADAYCNYGERKES